MRTASALAALALLCAVPVRARAADDVFSLPGTVWSASIRDAAVETESKGAAAVPDGSRLCVVIGTRAKGKLAGPQRLRLDILDATGRAEGSVDLDEALAGGESDDIRPRVDALVATADGTAWLASARLRGVVRLVAVDLAKRAVRFSRDIALGDSNLEIRALQRSRGDGLLLVGGQAAHPFVAELSKEGTVVSHTRLRESWSAVDGIDIAAAKLALVGSNGLASVQLQTYDGDVRAPKAAAAGPALPGRFPVLARGARGDFAVAWLHEEAGRFQAQVRTYAADGLRPGWQAAIGPRTPLATRFDVLPTASGGYLVAGVSERTLFVVPFRGNGSKAWDFSATQAPPDYPMFKGATLVKLGRDAVLVTNLFVLTAGGREQQQIVKVTRLAVD